MAFADAASRRALSAKCLCRVFGGFSYCFATEIAQDALHEAFGTNIAMSQRAVSDWLVSHQLCASEPTFGLVVVRSHLCARSVNVNHARPLKSFGKTG